MSVKSSICFFQVYKRRATWDENKGLHHNNLGSNPAQSIVPITSVGPNPCNRRDCPDPLSQLSFPAHILNHWAIRDLNNLHSSFKFDIELSSCNNLQTWGVRKPEESRAPLLTHWVSVHALSDMMLQYRYSLGSNPNVKLFILTKLHCGDVRCGTSPSQFHKYCLSLLRQTFVNVRKILFSLVWSLVRNRVRIIQW